MSEILAPSGKPARDRYAPECSESPSGRHDYKPNMGTKETCMFCGDQRVREECRDE